MSPLEADTHAARICGTFFESFSSFLRITKEKWSGRRGSNPQHPAWESEFSILYFQYLQNLSETICVHAAHTVHALPDLRVAAGRLRDGFYHALLFATTDLRLTFWIGEECFLSRRIWASNSRPCLARQFNKIASYSFRDTSSFIRSNACVHSRLVTQHQSSLAYPGVVTHI